MKEHEAEQIEFLKEACLLNYTNISENAEIFMDSPAAKLLFPEKK